MGQPDSSFQNSIQMQNFTPKLTLNGVGGGGGMDKTPIFDPVSF